MKKSILYIAILLGIYALYQVFGKEYFIHLSVSILDQEISISYFIEMLLIGLSLMIGVNLVRKIVIYKVRNTTLIQESNKQFIAKISEIGIYVFSFLFFISFFNIDISAFAFFGGALGIGIGFGLQKITANLISGIILTIEKSIRINDIIELNDGEIGTVKNILSRCVILEKFDGKEILVPNEDIVTNRVINWTYIGKSLRISINIGVSYDTKDLDLVLDLLIKSALAEEKCIREPYPYACVTEFADNSINFLLLFWIEDIYDGMFTPRSNVLKNIWKNFLEHDISIPYPQLDVYLKK